MPKSAPKPATTPATRAKRATIRDVAAQANVSIGTVSRVVSRTAHVSDHLSQRVLSVAEELGYRPRPRASSRPKTPRVRLISCFVSDLSNLLYGYVVSAAEERLAQLGYTLVVANTRNESRREDELMSLLREKVVEGAIISFGEETRPTLGAELAKAGIPAVILDRTPPKGIDSVLIDHRDGAANACSYLIGLGHKRIGLITASLQVRPGQERVAGFMQAHAQAGLKVADGMIRAECSTADAAFAESMKLLRQPERPTALMTLGSQALGGTLRAIRECGLSIPQDVSVICFGDTEMAKVVDPAITCVQWDRWQLGRQAVDLLVQRISNRVTEARTVILPTEIILRQSCQPPR